VSQPQPPAQPYGGPAPAAPPVYGPPPGWAPPPGSPPPYPGQPAAYPTSPVPYSGPPTGFEPAPYPGSPAAFAPAPMGYPAAPYAPQQPAYPGGPVPGQDFSGPPPAPATPYPGAAAGQMAMLSCRLCGSVPAVNATFRGHVGMVYLMRFKRFEGPFCRDCGLGTFRHMTSRTLVQGWYGYASFVITPITVLINLVRRNKVARLAPPQPNPFGPSRQPMNPGNRLLARPMTWIGLAIPFVVLALLILAISADN
jgi:hypothetical protein